MAKIYCRNKNYNGISATVPFVNGVGEIPDSSNLIEWFKDKGYDVVLEETKEMDSAEDAHTAEEPVEEPIEEPIEEPVEETEVKESDGDPISPYAEMQKADLIKVLREKGFEVNNRMHKEELLAMLKGAE